MFSSTNYLVPLSENPSGIKVIGEKLFSINGAFSQLLEWDEYGFRVQVPAGATTGPCDIVVKAIISGEFEIPEGCELVSALYAISASRKFIKPVDVEIEHCVRLENEQDCKFMCFGITTCKQEVLPYTFKIIKNGVFTPRSKFGKVFQSSFSIIGIFKWLTGAPDSDIASSYSDDEPIDDSESSNESQASYNTAQTELPAKLQLKPNPADLLIQVGAALHKWNLIGVLLRIDSGRLEAISQESTDDGQLLYRVFVTWEKSGSSPYTWAIIIDALKTPVVGEIRLAEEIEKWVLSQP